MSVQIWHNPRCSKSRQTLALLEENNVTPEVILYLESNPKADDIQSVLKKLDISARELLRSGEDVYKEQGLKDKSLSDAQLIDAMVKSPKLIQRPIVIHGEQARIGRPPEQVLEIL